MDNKTFDASIEQMKNLFIKLPRSDDGQSVVFDEESYKKCITYIWENFVLVGSKFFRRIQVSVDGYCGNPVTCFMQLADCVESDMSLIIQTVSEMVKRKDDGGSIPEARKWFLDLYSSATNIQFIRNRETPTGELNPFQLSPPPSGSVMMIGRWLIYRATYQ